MAEAGKKREGRLRWRTIIIPLSTVRFWVSFFLVLLLAAGVFAVLWYQFLGPRGQSRTLITRAEKAFDQAVVAGIKELAFEPYRTAQDDLFQAKKNWDAKNYVASKLMAEEALSVLSKAMEGLRSEGYFVRDRKASVSYSGGEVEVNQAGSLEWRTARRGTELRKGDRVRTRSGGSCVVSFDDGSQLTIKSDSLVLIDQLTEDTRTRTKSSAIKLLESDVEADILRPAVKGSRFLVETPNAVAQVNRARMNIRVSKERGSEFNLTSGEVTLQSGGREVALGDNETVSLTAPGVVERSRQAGAPTLLSPEQLVWMVSREETRPVTFSWTRVPEARSYRLTVSTDRFFTNRVVDAGRVQGESFRTAALKPGLYYWKVASVDGKGREGGDSIFRVFRMVQDAIPPRLTFNDPILLFDSAGIRAYLSGAAEPGTTLLVDGIHVGLSPDGTFRSFLKMASLPGRMRVEATDQAGNVLSQEISVP